MGKEKGKKKDKGTRKERRVKEKIRNVYRKG